MAGTCAARHERRYLWCRCMCWGAVCEANACIVHCYTCMPAEALQCQLYVLHGHCRGSAAVTVVGCIIHHYASLHISC
jgi:hypothetical protein